MSLVGKQFPDVTVKAINEDGDELEFNLSKPDKPTLVFWYPKDFTFVCPTEIHAFQEELQSFEDRGYQVLGASCDTAEVHFAWLSTAKDNGGIEGVTFPLLADSRRALAKKLDILDYEVEHSWTPEDEEIEKVIKDGDNVTFRATYLIDKDGKVWHESVNDMPIGRNVHEYLRLIDAKAHLDKHGEVCPANWEKGDTAMDATRDGVANYLKNN